MSALSLHCDVFIKIGEVTSKCIEIWSPDILPFITDICSVYKNFLVGLILFFFHFCNNCLHFVIYTL